MKEVKVLGAGLSALLLGGCALFSRGEVEDRRYYSPQASASAPKVEPKRTSLELRLGRVTAGTYLGEKIAYRESNHEVGFYDDRFWTEKPEAYLRRTLKQVLFEEEGLNSVISGAAPTLEVELDSFDEVKAPQHLAQVQLSFSLHDDRLVRLQQTLTVERPVAATDKAGEASAVADALGVALRDAVHELTARVVKDIASGPPPAPCQDVAAGPRPTP